LLQQIYGDAPSVGTDCSPVRDIDHPDAELQAPVLVTDAIPAGGAVIDAPAAKLSFRSARHRKSQTKPTSRQCDVAGKIDPVRLGKMAALGGEGSP
jgi:hypothetical protein